MTDQHAAANLKKGMRSRSLLIAVAVAILALLAVILIARNSGDEGGASTPATEAAGITNNDEAATGAGLGGAVPGYGEPNRPPTGAPADGTGTGASGATTGPTAAGTAGPAPQG